MFLKCLEKRERFSFNKTLCLTTALPVLPSGVLKLLVLNFFSEHMLGSTTELIHCEIQTEFYQTAGGYCSEDVRAIGLSLPNSLQFHR